MKIAIFSDLHGNYQATKAILDDIKANSYDEVICLGDIIGLGPKSKETLELILNSNIDIVLGNHDLYYTKGIEIDDEITEENDIEHHNWINDCVKDIPKEKLDYPLSKKINVNGLKLLFQHYMLSKDTSIDPYPFETISTKNMEEIEDYCRNMDCDYMFVGHKHEGFEVHENNKHIICIGSSGSGTTNKTFYVIIDTDNGNISITKKEIEYDREGFINDMKSFKYPEQEQIAKDLFGIDNI